MKKKKVYIHILCIKRISGTDENWSPTNTFPDLNRYALYVLYKTNFYTY